MFLVSRRSGCTWLSLRMFTVKEPQFGRSFKIAEILDLNFLETTKESHASNPGDIYKQTTVPLLPSPIAFTTLMYPFYPLKVKPEQKMFSPPPPADRPVSLLLLSLSSVLYYTVGCNPSPAASPTLSPSLHSHRGQSSRLQQLRSPQVPTGQQWLSKHMWATNEPFIQCIPNPACGEWSFRILLSPPHPIIFSKPWIINFWTAL